MKPSQKKKKEKQCQRCIPGAVERQLEQEEEVVFNGPNPPMINTLGRLGASAIILRTVLLEKRREFCWVQSGIGNMKADTRRGAGGRCSSGDR